MQVEDLIESPSVSQISIIKGLGLRAFGDGTPIKCADEAWWRSTMVAYWSPIPENRRSNEFAFGRVSILQLQEQTPNTEVKQIKADLGDV